MESPIERIGKRTGTVEVIIKGIKRVATGTRRVWLNADKTVSDVLEKASLKRPY